MVMLRSPERILRTLSVRQRMSVIIALLLVPLAVLSSVSMIVLNEQEMAFRDTVEESVHGLVPLATLEYYLQQALVDELLAESHDSVPDFATLAQNVDTSFSSIQSGAEVPKQVVDDAQKAWVQARPSVRRLVERVHKRNFDGTASNVSTRTELELAVRDISAARVNLSRALQTRYENAAVQRSTQLHWLIWSWLITLAVAGVLIMFFLHSLLRPIQALTQAARRLEEGQTGVRVHVDGRDELAVLADCFNRMTAHWEVTHADLQSEAIKDPLTGVLNRRGILSQLEAQLEVHRIRQEPLSVLAIDLDHFKFINDHYGHSTGDRALTWVASTMVGMLRAGDLLGRHGGDEFIAVLPTTNHANALEIAGRIAELVREGAAREAAYPEISIGVATAPEDGSQSGSLLEVADARLYAQKRHRRKSDDAQGKDGLDAGG